MIHIVQMVTSGGASGNERSEPRRRQNKNMDIQEIRQLREALEWELGEAVDKFEQATGCDVGRSMEYRSRRWFDGDPKVTLTVEIGYDFEPDDAEAEEIPEKAEAASA